MQQLIHLVTKKGEDGYVFGLLQLRKSLSSRHNRHMPFTPITTELVGGLAAAAASDLKGPLAGKKMSELLNLIKTGNAYVNVHKKTKPKR